MTAGQTTGQTELYPLHELQDAFVKRINRKLKEIFGRSDHATLRLDELELHGERPRGAFLKLDRAPSDAELLGEIKKGIAFYLIEDLLCSRLPLSSKIEGLFLRYAAEGEPFFRHSDTLPLGDVIGADAGASPFFQRDKHPGENPGFLRTFDDADRYVQAARKGSSAYAFLTGTWGVRHPLPDRFDNSELASLVRPYRGGILLYRGAKPSKVAEQYQAVIGFILNGTVEDGFGGGTTNSALLAEYKAAQKVRISMRNQ